MTPGENDGDRKAAPVLDLGEQKSGGQRTDELELRMHGGFQQERVRDDSVLLKGFLIFCGVALVIVLAVGISRWISQSEFSGDGAASTGESTTATDPAPTVTDTAAVADAMPAPPAVNEQAVADMASADAEAQMAAAEDAGVAAADAQFAAEAERERLLAEAEAARARKEALQAERELLAEQRRQAEQSAQMAAAAPKASCPYNVANPLKCASRDRQPTACAWDFAACGMPRLFKQESKTTCTGKMSADEAAGRIIIVDGCRGLFVPEI